MKINVSRILLLALAWWGCCVAQDIHAEGKPRKGNNDTQETAAFRLDPAFWDGKPIIYRPYQPHHEIYHGMGQPDTMRPTISIPVPTAADFENTEVS